MPPRLILRVVGRGDPLDARLRRLREPIVRVFTRFIAAASVPAGASMCPRNRTAMAADEQDWHECCAQTAALRSAYDPRHEWTETTVPPEAYLQELEALHARHRVTLIKRFAALFQDYDC